MMIALYLSLLVDHFLKDPMWFPHPVRFMGHYTEAFETTFRNNTQDECKTRTLGFFLTLSLVAISYTLVLALLYISDKISKPFGFAVRVFFMWTCVSLGCLKEEVRNVRAHVEQSDLAAAKRAVSMLVSRDTDEMDFEAVNKALIETAVENTSDGIIAPLFYLFLGGAPLGMAYKACNTLDSMVGYKNEQYKDFGFISAKLDDIVNFIPARLTAFSMILWAFLTGRDHKNGAHILRRDHANSKSPNAGWPEAAAAGILHIKILGDAKYFGKWVHKKAIGDADKPIDSNTVAETLRMITGATLVFVACFSACMGVVRFVRTCRHRQ